MYECPFSTQANFEVDVQDRHSTSTGRQPVDEVAQYVKGRYLGSSEAAWHLLSFKMQSQYPNVVRLGVHLHDEQFCTFRDDASAEDLCNLARPCNTLLAWFKLNRSDAFARTLLYRDIPAHYTWVLLCLRFPDVGYEAWWGSHRFHFITSTHPPPPLTHL